MLRKALLAAVAASFAYAGSVMAAEEPTTPDNPTGDGDHTGETSPTVTFKAGTGTVPNTEVNSSTVPEDAEKTQCISHTYANSVQQRAAQDAYNRTTTSITDEVSSLTLSYQSYEHTGSIGAVTPGQIDTRNGSQLYVEKNLTGTTISLGGSGTNTYYCVQGHTYGHYDTNTDGTQTFVPTAWKNNKDTYTHYGVTLVGNGIVSTTGGIDITDNTTIVKDGGISAATTLTINTGSTVYAQNFSAGESIIINGGVVETATAKNATVRWTDGDWTYSTADNGATYSYNYYRGNYYNYDTAEHEGNLYTEKDNIVINGGDVDIHGNMIAANGSIIINKTDGIAVQTDGYQSAGSIRVDSGTNNVDGYQHSSGTIDVTGTNVVGNGQTADGNITVNNGGKNNVSGGQESGGIITVNTGGTNIIHSGDQQGASIEVGLGDAYNHVAGNQTATTGDIKISGQNWVGKAEAVGGTTDDAVAGQGDQKALAGDIIINGGDNYVYGDQVAGTESGPAGCDIIVQRVDANATGDMPINQVTGSQIATGDIKMSGMTTTGDDASFTDGHQQAGNDIILGEGSLRVGEYQQAGNNITITGTTLTVNGNTSDADGKTVAQLAGSSITMTNANVDLTTGDQTAKGEEGYIDINGAEVNLLDGDMVAEGAANAKGNYQSITVTNGTVHVVGNAVASSDTHSNMLVTSTEGKTVGVTIEGVVDVVNSLDISGAGSGTMTINGLRKEMHNEANLHNSAINSSLSMLNVGDNHTLKPGKDATVLIQGKDGVTMTVTGTIDASADWTSIGTNTVDGEKATDGSYDYEGTITSNSNITLKGENTIKNGATVTTSGDDKAITIESTKPAIANTITDSTVKTTGNSDTINITGVAKNVITKSYIGTDGNDLTGDAARTGADSHINVHGLANDITDSTLVNGGADSTIAVTAHGLNTITASDIKATESATIKGSSNVLKADAASNATKVSTDQAKGTILVEATNGDNTITAGTLTNFGADGKTATDDVDGSTITVKATGTNTLTGVAVEASKEATVKGDSNKLTNEMVSTDEVGGAILVEAVKDNTITNSRLTNQNNDGSTIVVTAGGKNTLDASFVHADKSASVLGDVNDLDFTSVTASDNNGTITIAGEDGESAATSNSITDTAVSASGADSSIRVRGETNMVDGTSILTTTNTTGGTIDILGQGNTITSTRGVVAMGTNAHITIAGIPGENKGYATTNTITDTHVHARAAGGVIDVKGTTNAITGTDVRAGKDITVDGTTNTITGVRDDSGTTTGVLSTTDDGGSITVTGETNTLTNIDVTATGVSSRVEITGTSDIRYSHIVAGDLDPDSLAQNTDSSIISIVDRSAKGQSRIIDTTIESAGTIDIDSQSDQPTAITTTEAGKTIIVAHNDAGKQTGIWFHDVALTNLDSALGDNALNDADKEVYSMQGDILISGEKNTMAGTELSVDTTDANTSIRLDQGAKLTMRENTHFEGKLSSVGATAIDATIIKKGGDTLTLDHNAQQYNGTIRVNMGLNDGSDLLITGTCAGLGMNSIVQMEDSNFTVSADAFNGENTNGLKPASGVVTFGTLDTSSDKGARNNAVNDDTLANAGMQSSFNLLTGEVKPVRSYTDDGGTRTKYQHVGTVISFDASAAGNQVEGTSMKMNEYSLLRIDTAYGLDAQPTVDHIALTGTKLERFDGELDANGARVLVATVPPHTAVPLNLGDEPLDPVMAEQTRVQFLSAEKVQSAFQEDALYDVAFDAESGTYQRLQQNMNVWVETQSTGDGIGSYLVYSRNFRTAEGKDYNQGQVAGVLNELSKRHNQAEGNRQTSASRFENLLDAFDYTRSEGAALAGLTSVSGATSTVAQHSVMESSRHHLDTLRQWIDMPTCPEPQPVVADDGKEMAVTMRQPVDTKSSVWATYTGGYDMIDEDSALMDGYTRTYQGALMGYSREVNCKLLLGIALGYENSVARSEDTHVHGDTYMFDLYGSARTGKFNHRFSVGMGIHRFAEQRGVHVIAENGHTFSGNGFSDYRAKSINVGYELSRDFQVTERSTVSPYLAVNYAYHWFGELEEQGMGDAGLVTDLEAMNQLEAAVGARYAYSFGLVKDQAPATFFASAELKAEFTDHEPTARHYFKAHEDIDWRTKSIERSPFYGEIGVGLTVPFAERWSGTVSASYEFGSSRDSINAGAGVHYSF